MTAAIAVPIVLSLVLLGLILLVIPVAKLAVKYTKSTVLITFSVEDKPRSLAKALEVFKDCDVNILGLNTYPHHAESDRDAGNGYKFNYVHCMCTKADKKFLKNKLGAEIEGNYLQYPV